MKPYEFMRFYHPRLGRFMYKHKGSGIIVDNIFKSVKNVLSSAFKKVVKPMSKKAIESGISTREKKPLRRVEILSCRNWPA